MIWFDPEIDLAKVKAYADVRMSKALGIEFTDIGDESIQGRMPVSEATTQPAGLLHGGASCVLAETLGSVGANCCVDPKKKMAVGMEINANHLRAVTEGYVEGLARPIHLGRTSQVWQIGIKDSEGRLTCVSRLTLAIINR